MFKIFLIVIVTIIGMLAKTIKYRRRFSEHLTTLVKYLGVLTCKYILHCVDSRSLVAISMWKTQLILNLVRILFIM